MRMIVCYGDSNTHGTLPMTEPGVSVRHAPGDRWTDVLAQALGSGHAVIPEGLPGRTTVHEDPVEGGMRNGAAVLPAVLHSHKPVDLLVLMLGTNDLKPRFSVTAVEIARSVERLALIARAESVVGDLLIVAPPPVREAGCLSAVFEGAEARQRGLGDLLGAVARRVGAGFVDAGATVAVSAQDGVHWDAAAHRAFGSVMADAVRARLG